MRDIEISRQEYLTIIAPSADAAMEEYRAKGLAQQGYAIVAKIVPHRFTVVGEREAKDPFPGEAMVAATFARSVSV